MPNLQPSDVIDRVREILPTVTDETQLHQAAVMLAASLNAEVDYGGSTYKDRNGETVVDTSVFGTDTSTPKWSVSSYFDSPLAIRSRRIELTPGEVANRATFTSAPFVIGENGEPVRNDYRNRGADVPTVTGAPDGYTGVRATVVATRSAKGRTGSIVRKHGTPAVAGSPVATVATNTAAIGPTVRRTASQTVVPFHHATGPTASVVGHLLASHLETDARPLTDGRRSGIDVAKVTDAAYRHLGLEPLIGTEARGYAEVTPEMFDFLPVGVAVHRADMSGQSGVLALTASQMVHDMARWPDRNRLPRPSRYRNADTVRTSRTLCDLDGVTDTPSSETFVVTAVPSPDIEHRTRTVVRQQGRTLRTVQVPDTRERIWQGHRLIERQPADVKVSKQSTGKRDEATVLKLNADQTPTTVGGWQAIAEHLNRGERITGTNNVGATWTLSRTAKTGQYSGTANGIKFGGLKTTIGAARKLHNLNT